MPLARALASVTLVLLLASASMPAPAQPRPDRPATIAGRAAVIDGRTLEIRGTRIRLYGIEQAADDHVCTRTDDERWRCGPRALNALEAFLDESVVSCVVREKDAAGQVVATCTAGGVDVGLWLVRSGLASVTGALSGSGAGKAR